MESHDDEYDAYGNDVDAGDDDCCRDGDHSYNYDQAYARIISTV